MYSGIKLQVCAAACDLEGHSKDDLRFKMLLGSPLQDRFPYVSVSVTLLSILIKYVSRPQAFTTAKMETSKSSERKRRAMFLSFQMANLTAGGRCETKIIMLKKWYKCEPYHDI